MRLEHLRLQFQERERRGEFSCCVSPPASHEDISEAEQRLKVSFPQQVKMFYQCLNGLRVESPPLEILPIDRLHRDSETRLHFATLDDSRPLYFDTSRRHWLTADYATKRRILEIVLLNCQLDGATLCPTIRKPFDALAEGLVSENSRGDWI
jgi:cell wall assembly regulator SMI1